ncbi:MAG: hypothetical protein EZS28_020228 [Streblomastix strix]|uniref:Uncharacterized protein n=1 Tax=Streblomastix strix TaxID=222440 RepID=A0A5J4VNZ4_9EUKA|nr:MAG: hypothetical protein EZS28_020228 [Streblomastix strix]
MKKVGNVQMSGSTLPLQNTSLQNPDNIQFFSTSSGQNNVSSITATSSNTTNVQQQNISGPDPGNSSAMMIPQPLHISQANVASNQQPLSAPPRHQ